MPVMLFKVRWPDGAVETHYSPSTVIQDFLEAGRSYPLADFVELCRKGLHAASTRVAAVYGGAGCSRAMAQLAAIEAKAAAIEARREADPAAPVHVEALLT